MPKPTTGTGAQSQRPDFRITTEQLHDFVRAFARAVAECLEEIVTDRVVKTIEAARGPALLDRAAMAESLDVSLPTLDRLRRDGCPEITIGDAPRFELERVLAWLRKREQ